MAVIRMPNSTRNQDDVVALAREAVDLARSSNAACQRAVRVAVALEADLRVANDLIRQFVSLVEKVEKLAEFSEANRPLIREAQRIVAMRENARRGGMASKKSQKSKLVDDSIEGVLRAAPRTTAKEVGVRLRELGLEVAGLKDRVSRVRKRIAGLDSQ